MYKRGQATVFIIIGLVVLLIVTAVILYKSNVFQSEWEREQAEALTVPEEAEEVQDFVLGCVEQITVDAVNLMGMQGGYIDIPDDPIAREGFNIFSNSLEIFPESDMKTAYWFYEAANGIDTNQIPTIDSMESELAAYVDDNLASCIDLQDDLIKDYNATFGEIFTEVEILDEKVLFTVNYPMSIEMDDFSFTFPSFYEDINVPLGSMYDSAVEVMATENEEFIFEDLTFDMLALSEDIPVSGADFECEQEEWEVEDIEETFKEILFYNSLAIKVKKTNYEVNTESEEGYFELDLLDGTVDYNANVMYSTQWPVTLEVFPSEDGVLVEDSYTEGGMGAFLGTLFCLNSYNFIYDIKHPLLISFYDEDSDFQFQFATMVILDNNQPRENVEGTFEITDEGSLCEFMSQKMTVYALEVDPSGSFVELEGADVSYQCVTTQCGVGVTQGTRGTASLTTYFPQCYNGQVIVEKEGYYTGSEIVSTIDGDVASVVMERLYDLSYDIMIVDIEGNERAPTSDESIFITLTEEDGFIANAYYPEYEGTVEIIPGSYSVYATLIKEGDYDISVNGQSFEKCVSVPMVGIGGIFGLEKDQCYDVDLDDLNLDHAMTGGLELTWDIDRYELDSASKVTFYVTEVGEPTQIEDLEEIYSALDTGMYMREPELS
ncbi:hypothetical protein HOD38_00880 [archaeon]|jgi:hypothetical protein|nr:hypothetical protein [archaeon]MBT4396800.1 hypothetical protein [archaeon]MBT4441522.1 hypothetical protein [archaeon]